MKFKGLLLFVVATCACAVPNQVVRAQPASQPAAPTRESIDAMIHQLWAGYQDKCRQDFAQRMKVGDVYGLYDIQLSLDNLQRYASDTKDIAILNDLAGIYLEALPALRRDKDGFQKWVFTATETQTAKENPQLVDRENELSSSQFLFLVTSLLRTTAKIDPPRRG